MRPIRRQISAACHSTDNCLACQARACQPTASAMPLRHRPHRHPPDPARAEQIAALRAKLAPDGRRGQRGRAEEDDRGVRRAAVAGQVVERICRDVRTRGLEAVLEYTAKLDDK